MAERLSLSVVTPEKVNWEGPVDSVVVPAFDGELGILKGHAPLLAQLVPGIVKITDGEKPRVLSVSGGFVEVYEDRVALFAETAELDDEIDAERARQAVEKAKSVLRSRSEGPSDFRKVELALKVALARQRAVALSRRRSGKA